MLSKIVIKRRRTGFPGSHNEEVWLGRRFHAARSYITLLPFLRRTSRLGLPPPDGFFDDRYRFRPRILPEIRPDRAPCHEALSAARHPVFVGALEARWLRRRGFRFDISRLRGF